MPKLKVAMIAPPWLPTPPNHYGGTESVIDNLCNGLAKLNVEVELFTIKGASAPASKHHWYYQEEQFEHMHKPLDYSGPVLAHHVLEALDTIRQGDFDIIHDHTTYLGPAFMRDLPDGFPPVLHTLHGPFTNDQDIKNGAPDNRPMYRSLAKGGRLYFNGISNAQIRQAPPELKPKIVGAVHHGIDPSTRKFYPVKSDYFVNVGRIAKDKGIGLGIKLAKRLGEKFKIAGTVVGLSDSQQIEAELSNPVSRFADMQEFAYFRDHIRPLVDGKQVEYIGGVFGAQKDEIIGRAKAFLFPIQWDEPFGVAVVDALVCGTPVIAMRRGSLPEIIEHGVNGFLADSEEEFEYYMTQAGQINPAECRRSVKERFSYKAMAQSYLGKYIGIINRHAPVFAEEPAFSFFEMLQQQKKRP